MFRWGQPPDTPPPWVTYAQELWHLKYGHPMWVPEPDVRYGEVRLGDVGYLREGYFCFLFNCMLPADDPAHVVRGVPDGFEVLQKPSDAAVVERPNFVNVSTYKGESVREVKQSAKGGGGTTGVTASAQVAYQSLKSSGAILNLEHPGHRTLLECDDLIREYMTKHIERWYNFAKVTHRIDIRDQDIILVSGFIKTPVWHEAVWSGMKGSKSIAFDISGGALVASGTAGLELLRGHDLERSVVTRSGPHPRLMAPAEQLSPRQCFPADQCIFLSYHKVQRRRLHNVVMRAAAGPHQLPPGPGRDESQAVVLSYEPEFDDGLEIFAADAPSDPVGAVLNYILEHSSADVACASDADVHALFEDGYLLRDIVALRRGSMPIDIDGDNVGYIARPRAQSSAGLLPLDFTDGTAPPHDCSPPVRHDNESTCEDDLWGILLPANSNNTNISRINFYKSQSRYTIGRDPENDIRFSRCLSVSTQHCSIEWDEAETPKSAVILTDTSSNGTFIDGVRVNASSGARCKLLTDGCEIAFGSYVGNKDARALDDYRFIFRHKACKAPADGVDKVYDVQHLLGRGPFGTVMKALHHAEGNWYAVKIIPTSKLRKAMTETSADAVTPDTIPSALKREITILQRLEHKNICLFKEVFYESQGISIVQELVKGGDLLDYLYIRTELPEPVVQRLTHQICDALAYCHGLGIYHRDLKPENILLTDDNPPIVKVADFGLAKVVDTITAMHTFGGTPVHLPPEIVNGAEGYDHVVDSWSVGVLVWAMFTMCIPFVEDSEITDLAKRLLHSQIDWYVLETCHVTEFAMEFIRRLLEYDPKKRMTITEAREHPWLRVISL